MGRRVFSSSDVTTIPCVAAILVGSRGVRKARICLATDGPNDEPPKHRGERTMGAKLTRRDAIRTVAAAARRRDDRRVCHNARAIEPIARSGRPKFKFSLAGYSYRDLFKPNNKFAKEALTLHDFISDCAKMQLEGTELTSYYFPTPLTRRVSARICERQCFRLGLDVSGTAVGNDFCHPAGPQRDTADCSRSKQWIDVAAVLARR